MDLNGRVVLVTGASSGIGAATARLMARRGARVVLVARDQVGLESVVADVVRDGGSAYAYPADLTDFEAVARLGAEVREHVGVPDVLINNAGAGRWLFVEETSPGEAVQMMAAPYFAAFFTTRELLPEMLKRGSGHIANITSLAAFFPWPGATAYTAARWAMRGFSDALQSDLAGTGIGVTLFASSAVQTAYWANNPGTSERLPGVSHWFPMLTSDQAARAIVEGVERGRREVIIPAQMRLLVGIHRFMPGLVRRLLIGTGHRRYKA